MSSVFVSHTGYCLAVLTADLIGRQRKRLFHVCLTAQLPNVGPWPPVLRVLKRDISMGEAVNPSPNPQPVGPGLCIYDLRKKGGPSMPLAFGLLGTSEAPLPLVTIMGAPENEICICLISFISKFVAVHN